MILVLTAPSDTHADRVVDKLRQRGADFFRFDPARFPAGAELSLAYSAGGRPRFTLRSGGQAVDLSGLSAVWYRRPGVPVPHAAITEPPTRDYLSQECKDYLRDAWESVPGLWLPGHPAAIHRAQLKAAQLGVAGALGFELPPTLFTNSPDDFLEFYRSHNGNVVSKLAGPSFSFEPVGRTYCRYTELVSRRDAGYAQAVRYGPVIFQANVPKRVEVRVTVVGRQVFAAEIRSQANNHTRLDWRRYDLFDTPYAVHELPPDLERRCVRLVERLGLCYGAIDLVLTPDGRYVFLEINPNGQYLWIEEATGLPISDAICDMLIAGAAMDEPEADTLECQTGGPR